MRWASTGSCCHDNISKCYKKKTRKEKKNAPVCVVTATVVLVAVVAQLCSLLKLLGVAAMKMKKKNVSNVTKKQKKTKKKYPHVCMGPEMVPLVAAVAQLCSLLKLLGVAAMKMK